MAERGLLLRDTRACAISPSRLFRQSQEKYACSGAIVGF